ncbi:MAG: hypothetical protein KA163_07295 [Bacteroidia bacterium]|nr:hypothetical protein [Bacteroidia bacterium]
MLKVPIKTAPFQEHPVANIMISEPNEFDVIAYENLQPDFILNGNFNLEQYCRCLLQKLLTLNKSKIKPFLQYQCGFINNPFIWLNKLEKLIDLNRDHFTTKEQNIKIEKALMVIELLRQEIESGKLVPANRFNFNNIKQQLKNYSAIEDKLLYLMETKTEYLQNRPAFTNHNEVPFDEKCELEIILLKNQKRLGKKRAEDFGSQTNKSPLGPLKKSPASPVKSKINTNLNRFVDIFFRLMHETKVNGKPGLEAQPQIIAEMISAWFIDKDGNEISIETVKTILKPSRIEKRPKGNSKFDLL